MKVTLIIGASTNPERYAYKAANMLVAHKHEIALVGVREGELFGQKIHTNKPIFENIDTITLYVSAKNQLEWYDYIIETKPRRIIFNPNTENEELRVLAEANNIQTEYACTLVLLASGQY